jgi:hypothetical protein
MNGFIVILAPSRAKDHKVIRNSELIAMMLGASSNTQQTKGQTKEMIVKPFARPAKRRGNRYKIWKTFKLALLTKSKRPGRISAASIA